MSEATVSKRRVQGSAMIWEIEPRAMATVDDVHLFR